MELTRTDLHIDKAIGFPAMPLSGSPSESARRCFASLHTFLFTIRKLLPPLRKN